MRRACALVMSVAVLASCGCSQTPHSPSAGTPPPNAKTDPPIGYVSGSGYVGFDRNEYPGDDVMQTLSTSHTRFAFVGYWLTPPPGASVNEWKGKRELLKRQGWGFLLLANGRFEREILKAQKAGTAPDALGRKDAAVAVAAAKAEGFKPHAIVFLDQEEGGRLTDPQAKYLLAWTEAVATSGYRPGVYASGALVQDGPGEWIDTIRDIRDRVKKGKLHEVAMFDAQDACPPAPGCTLNAKPLSAAGEPNLVAWQYSQSPRRASLTQSCAETYTANQCAIPEFPKMYLDLDVASSPDPSETR